MQVSRCGTNVKGSHRKVSDHTMELRDIDSRGSAMKSVLHDIMNTLAIHLSMSRGALLLIDPETNETVTEAAYGKYEELVRDGGLHEMALQKGMSVAARKSGGPPICFLDGAAPPYLQKPEIAYLCVPMKIEDTVVGALVVDRLFGDSVDIGEDFRLLNSITPIIAQTVKGCHMLEKKNKDLNTENERLRNELEKARKLPPEEGSQTRTHHQGPISVETLLQKKMDDIVMVLDVAIGGKKKLYADVIAKVEKALVKLALHRTKNVKYEAARFLGINRNTLHKKMKDLNI